MNYADIYDTIKTQWTDGGPEDIFFVTSEPGIGKSAMGKALGADPELGFDNVVDLNPSLLDTPDLAGIYLLGDDAEFLKSKHNEQLYRCRTGRNLIIWEEVPDSNLAMQNLKLSNRTCNLHMDPDLRQWIRDYALPGNLDPVGIQFLRYREPLFCAFNPDAEMGINPTPRSWTRAFRTSPRLSHLKYATKIAGEVGAGPAAEYVGFRKTYTEVVSIEDVIMNPTGVPIPSELSALYATVGHLAQNTSLTNVDRVWPFISRLSKDFSTAYWQDTKHKHPEIVRSRAFIAWAGDAGNVLFA